MNVGPCWGAPCLCPQRRKPAFAQTGFRGSVGWTPRSSCNLPMIKLLKRVRHDFAIAAWHPVAIKNCRQLIRGHIRYSGTIISCFPASTPYTTRGCFEWAVYCPVTSVPVASTCFVPTARCLSTNTFAIYHGVPRLHPRSHQLEIHPWLTRLATAGLRVGDEPNRANLSYVVQVSFRTRMRQLACGALHELKTHR